MKNTSIFVLAAMVAPGIASAQSFGVAGTESSPAAQQAEPQSTPQPPPALFNGTAPSYTMPDGTRTFRLDPKAPLSQLGARGPSFIVEWPSCPVSLEARQSMDGDLVKVRQGIPTSPDHGSKPGQSLHLIVRNTGIVSATIRVTGLSARTRFAASDVAAPPPDIWRTLQVAFTPNKDGGSSAFLKLPGFTSVTFIRVLSFTYADGTTWDPPNRSQCSVIPDPLMRIAGR